MTFSAFPPWRPDVSDLDGAHTQRLAGVTPRDDGYGPWPSHEAFTQSLPATCRGFFVARHASGVFIFAGTSERLYLLDNSTLTWQEVSLEGNAYVPLANDAMWQFAQFNNFVLATHRNELLQRFDMGTPTAFANCPGSPPQAGSIAIVNRFVVLSDLDANPNRIKWSGLNDTEEWESGTGLSGEQDFPDGGRAMRVAEMSQDVGLILQESGWRRMAFLPGNVDLVFQIDKLRDEAGLLAQYSLAVSAGRAYFLGAKGFMEVAIDGSVTPIGDEMVDRTFLRQANAPQLADLAYDDSHPHIVLAGTDPRHNRVLWAYKSVTGQEGLFDRVLIYHTTRRRWSPASFTGEYLAQVAKPAITLEGLDPIAPGAIPIVDADDNGSGAIRIEVGSTATLTTGDHRTISGVAGTVEANGDWFITVVDATHFDLDGSTFSNEYGSGGVVAGNLDLLPFSLDDVSTAVLPGLAAIDDNHRLGFFSGPPVEARLETAEQRAEGQRANINNIWPRTDAETVFGFISKRERLSGAPVDTAPVQMLEDGNCPLYEEARNGRAGILIPAGTEWTFASGVEIDAEEAGGW